MANRDTNYIYNYNRKIEEKLKNISKVKGEKRQVTSKQKKNIWNKARDHPGFDSEIFKLDNQGNLVIKGITQYRKNDPRKDFSYNYDHLISFKNGGPSNEENVVLLNGKFNNFKRDRNMNDISSFELKYLNLRYGVNPDDLLKNLNTLSGLQYLCERYNLEFIKNKDGKWSLAKDTNGDYSHFDYIKAEKIIKQKKIELKKKIAEEKQEQKKPREKPIKNKKNLLNSSDGNDKNKPKSIGEYLKKILASGCVGILVYLGSKHLIIKPIYKFVRNLQGKEYNSTDEKITEIVAILTGVTAGTVSFVYL